MHVKLKQFVKVLFNYKIKKICVFLCRISPNEQFLSSVVHIQSALTDLGYAFDTASPPGLPDLSELRQLISNLSSPDVSRLLFWSETERRPDGSVGGVYHVPGYGDLSCCGLQGFLPVLDEIRSSQDLGHPLCRYVSTSHVENRSSNLLLYIFARINISIYLIVFNSLYLYQIISINNNLSFVWLES